MYKSLWARVLACLAVVVVLSLSVLPLMVGAESTSSGLPSGLSIDPTLSGDAWGKESADFSTYYSFSLDNFSYYVAESLTKGIDYAYEGGMFGGSIPIAIVAFRASGNLYIDIITLTQSAYPDITSMASKTDARKTTTCTVSLTTSWNYRVAFAGNRTEYPGAQIATFRICNNGDFAVSAVANQRTIDSIYDSNAEATWRILALQTGYYVNQIGDTSSSTPLEDVSSLTKLSSGWYISQSVSADETSPNHWFAPVTNSPTSNTMEQWASRLKFAYESNATVYNDGYNAGYADGAREGNQTAYNTGYNAGYAEGEADGYTEGHAEGYTDGFLDGSPQMVEIENVITAVPNGLKSILDNALDFEIFGINVAGLLSVLLIVSIVGFVVKWLMTR